MGPSSGPTMLVPASGPSSQPSQPFPASDPSAICAIGAPPPTKKFHRSKAQEQSAGIPRPPNAWILYRSDKLRAASEPSNDQPFRLSPLATGSDTAGQDSESEGAEASGSAAAPGKSASGGAHKNPRQGDLSKRLASSWQNEKPQVRQYYYQLAEQRKEEHRRMFPDYKFAPRVTAKLQKSRDDRAAAALANKKTRDVYALPAYGLHGSSSGIPDAWADAALADQRRSSASSMYTPGVGYLPFQADPLSLHHPWPQQYPYAVPPPPQSAGASIERASTQQGGRPARPRVAVRSGSGDRPAPYQTQSPSSPRHSISAHPSADSRGSRGLAKRPPVSRQGSSLRRSGSGPSHEPKSRGSFQQQVEAADAQQSALAARRRASTLSSNASNPPAHPTDASHNQTWSASSADRFPTAALVGPRQMPLQSLAGSSPIEPFSALAFDPSLANMPDTGSNGVDAQQFDIYGGVGAALASTSDFDAFPPEMIGDVGADEREMVARLLGDSYLSALSAAPSQDGLQPASTSGDAYEHLPNALPASADSTTSAFSISSVPAASSFMSRSSASRMHSTASSGQSEPVFLSSAKQPAQSFATHSEPHAAPLPSSGKGWVDEMANQLVHQWSQDSEEVKFDDPFMDSGADRQTSHAGPASFPFQQPLEPFGLSSGVTEASGGWPRDGHVHPDPFRPPVLLQQARPPPKQGTESADAHLHGSAPRIRNVFVPTSVAQRQEAQARQRDTGIASHTPSASDVNDSKDASDSPAASTRFAPPAQLTSYPKPPSQRNGNDQRAGGPALRDGISTGSMFQPEGNVSADTSRSFSSVISWSKARGGGAGASSDDSGVKVESEPYAERLAHRPTSSTDASASSSGALNHNAAAIDATLGASELHNNGQLDWEAFFADDEISFLQQQHQQHPQS
ncbi:High mobility group box domain [Ceraceosorus bombacis]|uniref:High mobility group box domain n=1 Tax=Ceraceosorus bombacis TaxID=401625 RepID=A0A0P1BNS8_9BASI|nr:High mobility group box domain [Ceraceosorus bombacis]